jgi:hypothetical protein
MQNYWITWSQPGIYASQSKSTLPMTRDEAFARLPLIEAAASSRGWRFVRLIDADRQVLAGSNA